MGPRNDLSAPAGETKARSFARLVPIGLIAVAATAFFATGANKYLSFDGVRENYAALQAFVVERYWTALGLYGLAYVAVAALSLPGATLMSLLGGLLFGTLTGTAAVVASATVGATILFIAARTAFADFFRSRAAGFIKRMEAGFSENAFSYLLLLRLVPLFPFFIVNIVPAFTRMKTSAFVAATFIGIIPGAFAFVSAGNGLGAAIERGGEIDVSGLLLEPEILVPIVALGVLALIPILFRVLKKSPERA